MSTVIPPVDDDGMAEPDRTPRARHRKPEKRDGVLLGLKIGAFAVALGIGVGVVSVMSDDPRPQPAGADTRRPATTTATTTVEPGGPPSAPSIAPPPPPTATTVLAGPPASSVVPTTTTTTGRPTKTKKQTPGAIAVGDECDTPGAFAFIEFRAVVCRSDGPGEPPRWHLVY
jgi:hypothetical protein